MTEAESWELDQEHSIVLILGVCAPLIVLCDTFSVITSAVSFPGWSGDLWLLCYIITSNLNLVTMHQHSVNQEIQINVIKLTKYIEFILRN